MQRWLALLSCAAGLSAQPAVYLQFNGVDQYVEIPSSPRLSMARDGLTVSAWMRPDTLGFRNPEGSGYVHWLGKGEHGQQEWVFRMYNRTNTENPPRPNRISFYVFNPDGGLGVGSYFQERIEQRQWIQVTGVADRERTYIYKDGELQRCDQYQGRPGGGCHGHPEVIHPAAGSAPMRVATRDLRSYFQGGLAAIRIWDRPLSAAEVRAMLEKDQASRRGLAAEYLLNEGEGSIAHDSMGGANGRIVGAKWMRQ